MAPPSKLSNTSTARRKSTTKNDDIKSKIVIFKLSPDQLQKFAVADAPAKEESPSKDSASTISNPPVPVVPTASSDKPAESAPDTPAANGTPGPSSMPPPTETVKKRGIKRSSAVALGPDGLPIPKVRGKPGPKKRPRLEDGTIDHSNTTPRATGTGTATHKLGPKANQGAINAGLRALDRSGKPCRKWAKGSFKVKSFTGVEWEIPRWKAPPKFNAEAISGGSASGGSSKENKDNSQVASEKSNGATDIERVSGIVKNPGIIAPAPLAQPIPSTPPAPAEELPITFLASTVDAPKVEVENVVALEIEIKSEIEIKPEVKVEQDVSPSAVPGPA